MDYWEERQHFRYYAEVRRLIEAAPGASILDVGGRDTPVVTWGTFDRRYAIDIEASEPIPGVVTHVGDFLAWDPPEHMSVVVCCQVLEHLSDDVVESFGAKLMAIGDTVIVTVPFCWPAGGCVYHLQDPVTREKLARFMGRAPDYSRVVKDGQERIVAVWRSDAHQTPP